MPKEHIPRTQWNFFVNSQMISLTKYSPLAKRIIYEAQELADSLRHKFFTTSHLSAAIESFIAADRIIPKMGCKNHPLIPPDLAEAFSKQYEDPFHINFRQAVLRGIQERYLGAQAITDLPMRTLISFIEDKATVNARAIITELMLTNKMHKLKCAPNSLRRD
jgi:hypothetical protein